MIVSDDVAGFGLARGADSASHNYSNRLRRRRSRSDSETSRLRSCSVPSIPLYPTEAKTDLEKNGCATDGENLMAY